MRLTELLSPERIRIPLTADTKDDVLRELVSLLPDRARETADGILEAVLDREGRMSTGIGQGVAIPHGKTDLVQEMEMALGVAPKAVDYDALDGEPVDLFFLLVSPPEMTGPHIKLLALISRILSTDGFREELVRASSPQEILALLRREESEALED